MSEMNISYYSSIKYFFYFLPFWFRTHKWILLNEKNGCSVWLWEYPGTLKQLKKDWLSSKAPINELDIEASDFSGYITQNCIEKHHWLYRFGYYDAIGCIFQEENDYLRIKGSKKILKSFSSL